MLRYAGGVTKRANSVLPLGDVPDMDRAIAEAERFYAGVGLPCVFSIGAGATEGLDAELSRRGYRRTGPTLIMAIRLADVRSAAEPAGVEPDPSEDWLRTWWQTEGIGHRAHDRIPPRAWAERILTGVRAGYLHLPEGAVGRAVPQDKWLGIYCMAVAPHARRRGLGTSVLRTLLAWGRTQGAVYGYLAVTEANRAARALYEREGFTVVGRYHYRVKPEAEATARGAAVTDRARPGRERSRQRPRLTDGDSMSRADSSRISAPLARSAAACCRPWWAQNNSSPPEGRMARR